MLTMESLLAIGVTPCNAGFGLLLPPVIWKGVTLELRMSCPVWFPTLVSWIRQDTPCLVGPCMFPVCLARVRSIFPDAPHTNWLVLQHSIFSRYVAAPVDPPPPLVCAQDGHSG